MDMQRTDVAQRWATDEQGIAMLSVIMVMLLMTVLGFGALTMTGLENRGAGFASSMEASTAAMEEDDDVFHIPAGVGLRMKLPARLVLDL